MNDHVPTLQMERFCVSALPEDELVAIARHLSDCDPCHQLFSETLRRLRGTEGVRFTLAPEFWLRHEHLDYEQLVEIAENTLDATDREILDIHLSICATCKEDVRSFLAFRQHIEPELRVRYGPGTEKLARRNGQPLSWRRGLAWKPAYAAAAVILIAIALAIVVIVVRQRTSTLEAGKIPTPEISPRPTPSGERASTTPSPATPAPANQSASNGPAPTTAPSPKRTINKSGSPIDNPANVFALNDSRSKITLDKSGNITGLDDAPSETRRDVADALQNERIERPPVLTDLAPGNSSLRGNGSSGAPFRLLSPARAVIIESQPVFKWEELSGAIAYRIYVLDSKGHVLAKSEDLTSTIREWKLNAPLHRGNIYSWVVIAVIDGKEIVSPGPAAPQMKFRVLSAGDLQKMNQLKRIRSHLVLGVFDAKVGLLTEAEREFRELVRLNPNAEVAKKLLHSVRLMRSTPH